MPFLSTIVASEIVSGEYSKGTFRMYLTRPISRSEVILSKLIIVYIYTTLMMLFFYLYTVILSIIILGTGDLAVFHNGLLFLDQSDIIWRFVLAYIISNSIMLTITSLCFLFSTMSKNSVTPIISTISIVFIGTAISFIPIDFFEQVNPYLFTGYIDLFLTAFYDPIPKDKITLSILVSITWSVIFVSLSFYFFNKKDILD
jgi:ABC-2 type transport system permease protein